MSQALGEIRSHISGANPPTHVPVLDTELLGVLAATGAPHNWPEGELEMAALLESEGVTDVVAMRYGARDVFDLAQRLRAAQTAAAPATLSPPAPQTVEEVRLLPSMLRSVLMLGMLLLLLLGLHYYEMALHPFGIPGWTILLGLSAGMVVAGGVVQALGSRVSLVMSQGTVSAVRPVLRLGLVAGTGVACVAAAAIVAGGAALRLPPATLVGLGASCIGIAVLMLLSGSLVLLERAHLAGAMVILAFGAAWLARQKWLAGYSLLPTVAFGYGAAIALLGGALLVILYRLESKAKEHTSHQPPVGQLLYKAVPYLCYGALSVIYVFAGQLSGWLGQRPPGWSQDQAVAALNVAHMLGLVTLIVSQAITEHALSIFWHVVRDAQEQATLGDYSAISVKIRRFLRRHLRMLLLCQMLVALVVAALALWAWRLFDLAPAFGPLVPNMLFASLIGYSLLTWGLFGCSFAVTLVRPWLAARALLLAASVQFVVGLYLSRTGGFEASMIGTVAGGAFLVLLAHQTLGGLLYRIEFALYKAF